MIDDKTLKRFMSKVNKTDTCWLWTSAKNIGGYGVFGLNGKNILSHRLSYELYIGKIPEGLQIDHLCRVRYCVNPDHLDPVTQAENIRRGLSGYHKMSGNHERIKTSCPKGHLYSGKDSRGKRVCNVCRSESQKKYYNNKKIKGLVWLKQKKKF